MSNYHRKRDRSGELSQSGLKVIRKRTSGQVHLFSFYPVKSECILQKKKQNSIFSSKYFDLGCVSISNTGDDRERGIHSATSFSSREFPVATSTSFQMKTRS